MRLLAVVVVVVVLHGVAVCEGVTPLVKFGQAYRDLDASGGLVFGVASMLDVMEPGRPVKLVGRVPLSGNITETGRRVKVFGSRAYVGSTRGNVLAFDVSVPSAPRFLWQLRTYGETRDISVDGDRMCVADGEDGLKVADLSGGAARVIGYDTEEAVGVVCKGDLAYVLGAGSLRVVDLTVVSRPRERRSFSIGGGDDTRVTLVGDAVWVVGGMSFLYTLDVRDPMNPVLRSLFYSEHGVRGVVPARAGLGFLAYEGSTSLDLVDTSSLVVPTAVGGRRVHLGARITAKVKLLAGLDGWVMVGTDNELVAVEVLEGPSATAAGAVPYVTGDAAGPVLLDKRIVVFAGRRLVSYNVEDARNAWYMGHVETETVTGMKKVFGSRLLAWGPWGINVFGADGFLERSFPYQCVGVAMTERYLYAALNNRYLHVVDHTESPARVVSKVMVSTSGFLRDVAILSDGFVVVGTTHGVQAYNVSDPENVFEVKTVTCLSECAGWVKVSPEGYVLVGTQHTVDVLDARDPTDMKRVPFPSPPNDWPRPGDAAILDKAALVSFDDRVEGLDLADLAHPVRSAVHPWPSRLPARRIEVGNDFLFAAGAEAGGGGGGGMDGVEVYSLSATADSPTPTPAPTPAPPTTPSPPQGPVDCSTGVASTGRYYSYDGSCNNPVRPDQGRAGTAFVRTSEGTDFGRSSSSSADLPNVRVVSNAILRKAGGTAGGLNARGLNTLATFFGQFVAHDITEVVAEAGRGASSSVEIDLAASGEAERYPLGSRIAKSVEVLGHEGAKLNLNELTAYLDLSAVYGSDKEVAEALRAHEGGLMKTSNALLAAEGGARFRYRGKHFPLCRRCVNASTLPPTPVETFGMEPGVEPWGRQQCAVAPCGAAAPEVKCEVNPEWTSKGRYRDAVHEMVRDWLPLRGQTPGVPVAGAPPAPGSGEVEGFFAAGDRRITDNANLMTVHAMFLRNHNNKARALRAANPSMTDEELFQEARRANIYEYQNILYNEWLPAVLGEHAPGSRGAAGYNPEVDASISNLFATAAFRLHSLVPTAIALRYADGRLQSPENGFDRAPVPAHALGHGTPPTAPVNNELPGAGQLGGLFTPRSVLAFAGGEDAIVKSNLHQATEEHDRFVTETLRTLEVEIPCGPHAGRMLVDVPSATLARGRTHGLPGYDAVRKAFHSAGSVYANEQCAAAIENATDTSGDPLDCFRVVTGERACTAPVAELLQTHYKKVSDIDPWIGLVVEPRERTSALGLTHSQVIAEQFRRLRDGDRLFYTNVLQAAEVAAVERVTLQRLIESTFAVRAQENAFFVPSPDNQVHDDAVCSAP